MPAPSPMRRGGNDVHTVDPDRAGEHGGEAVDRPDREIQLPHDDHQREPERQEPQRNSSPAPCRACLRTVRKLGLRMEKRHPHQEDGDEQADDARVCARGNAGPPAPVRLVPGPPGGVEVAPFVPAAGRSSCFRFRCHRGARYAASPPPFPTGGGAPTPGAPPRFPTWCLLILRLAPVDRIHVVLRRRKRIQDHVGPISNSPLNRKSPQALAPLYAWFEKPWTIVTTDDAVADEVRNSPGSC